MGMTTDSFMSIHRRVASIARDRVKGLQALRVETLAYSGILHDFGHFQVAEGACARRTATGRRLARGRGRGFEAENMPARCWLQAGEDARLSTYFILPDDRP
jgi:hypothetical protein